MCVEEGGRMRAGVGVLKAIQSNDLVWFGLILATLITFWFGESGLSDSARGVAVLVIFGLAYAKAAGVILQFMELKHAPWLWRLLLLGWLTVVVLGILLAWLIGDLRA
ncbi:Hypothetical protein HDN1F_29450 [gamma proteobacterium HdN1]|nr:Hypothetical protein HDN1F_29450 [gamma proteobacterium HdN1]